MNNFKIRVLDAIEIEGKFEENGQLMELNLIEVRNGQFGPIGMCWSDENCKAIRISEGSLLGSLT